MTPQPRSPAATRLTGRFGNTWPREASGAPRRGGGTADGSDASAATIAVSGSRSGCRPRRAPYLSESIL
jgi:hypothetical protein